MTSLIVDPSKRKPIAIYDVNDRDIIRRLYLQRGPCQFANLVIMGRRWSSSIKRRFKSAWFDEFTWLEYSIFENSAFCLPCYLFPQSKTDDAFT